jgi:hypothetical protein
MTAPTFPHAERVLSRDGQRWYEVAIYSPDAASCTCDGWRCRSECRHVRLVLRRLLQQAERPLAPRCRDCGRVRERSGPHSRRRPHDFDPMGSLEAEVYALLRDADETQIAVIRAIRLLAEHIGGSEEGAAAQLRTLPVTPNLA